MDLRIILFSLLAFLILIPILFVLPLNLTRKGKFTILLLSFVTAATVLVMKTVLMLWQNILLMVALILFITLILSKRFSSLLFPTPEPALGEQKENQIKQKSVSKKTALENFSSTTTNNQSIVTPSLEEIPLQKDVILDQAFDQETIHPISDGADKDKPEFELVTEDNDEFPENEIEDLLVDRLEEMEPAETEPVNDDVSTDAITEMDQLSYLPELEEMMLNPEQEGEGSSKELEIDDVQEYGELELLYEEWSKASNDEVAVSVDTLEDNEQSLNVSEDILETIEDKEEMNSEDQEKTQEREWEEVLAEDHNVQDDEVSLADADITNFNIVDQETEAVDELPDSMAGNEIENEQMVEVIFNEKEMQKRKQVLTTMFLQAEIAQNSLENEQYEQLLLNFIHYDIPAEDRYPFAVLLIEHYSNINNNDELENIFIQLIDEFSEYPNLLQEIHYLQSNDVKK